jgi:cytochrome c-type biogenesis protein CcsB
MDLTNILLIAAFSCYGGSGIFIGCPNSKLAPLYDRIAEFFLCGGFVFHTVLFGLRWMQAGRPPFTSMFEALLLLSWGIVLLYFFFLFLWRLRVLLIPSVILVLITMGAILRADRTVKPLVPALQSGWITIHVVTYFVGYAALALACAIGLIYLLSRRRFKDGHAHLAILDDTSYRLIMIGFPLITIGMTTGSAWANEAWGTYWGWDPKETCSLVTWLVYVLYLHLRVLRGWKGVKTAWLAILGFMATLFTFVGVNYILPGLHSYAK